MWRAMSIRKAGGVRAGRLLPLESGMVSDTMFKMKKTDVAELERSAQ
jgi:hypothetical protein